MSEQRAERVQPTKYTLTIEFETSEEPDVSDNQSGLFAARAALMPLGITQATLGDVYLVSTPRWRSKPR